MNARIRTADQLAQAIQVLVMTVGALGLMVTAVSAVSGQGAAASFVDLPTERRILASLGPVEAPEHGELRTARAPSAGGRVSHAATLHRFRVELVDSAGRPVSGGAITAAVWEVTLFAGAAHAAGAEELKPLVRLSSADPDVRVPRPYGVQLDAGDSLLIVATVQVGDSSAYAVLRVTIEYESAGGPVSRLQVLSLCASEMPMARAGESLAPSDGVVRAWIWRPAVNGRMVAIAGRPLVGAQELVLEDATTGEVLWSTRAQSLMAGDSSAQQSAIIRPSVAVQEGRSYRLRASYASATAATSVQGGGTPLAILLPERAPAR